MRNKAYNNFELLLPQKNKHIVNDYIPVNGPYTMAKQYLFSFANVANGIRIGLLIFDIGIP